MRASGAPQRRRRSGRSQWSRTSAARRESPAGLRTRQSSCHGREL